MTMEIATLAAALVPFLVKGGEKLAEMVAEKLGNAGFEGAKGAWERLRRAIAGRPAAEDAVRDLAATPEDADYQAALRVQLKKLLEADTNLAEQLARALQAGPQADHRTGVHGDGAIAQGTGAVAAGKAGVAVGGDVHGGITLGGKGEEL